MKNEQTNASLHKVLACLGAINSSLIEEDEDRNRMHQCALEGLQTILCALCGLQRPPYNQVILLFAAASGQLVDKPTADCDNTYLLTSRSELVLCVWLNLILLSYGSELTLCLIW